MRNIADVTTAVANGDLSKKITVDVRGEVLQLKDTINTMVDQLRAFSAEVTRVAREVGTEGRLGGQANVEGVSGVWKDLTDNVNTLAGNLTTQVRNIAQVTTAVANGDLTKKITVDVQGEIAELKDTINTMVDQLSAFAAEVTRVAREVGTEGKLGGQAQVEGVSGTWRGLTESVNGMALSLTEQVRNIADVTTAVANGDLSKKVTVDVKGEVLELKNTINTMVDQLSAFAAEVTRVAREVGTEGRLGGQAEVEDVSGTWRDLTESVNGMASNLTDQVRNIAEVATAVAKGDLTQKITVDARGEILELKNTLNTMVDQLSTFADEVTRVAREVGTEGILGGQAEVRGRLRHVARPDREREPDGEQPDEPGAQHRAGRDRRRARRPLAEDHGRRARRDPRAEDDAQHDGRPALGSFADEVTRVAREVGSEGRLGGQAQVEGVSGTWRGLTESVNFMATSLTEQVRNIAEVDDRGRERRPLEEGDGRRARRDRRAEEHDQHDGRPALLVRRRGHARRARGRHRGQARRPGGGEGRLRRLEGPDGEREHARRQPHRPGAEHRRRHDRGRERRPDAEDHRRRARRGAPAQGHDQHDGRPALRVRRRGHARRARGRHRGRARRPGQGRRRQRHVARPDASR